MAMMKMKMKMAAMKAMKKKAMKKTAKSYKSAKTARAAVYRGTIMKTRGGLRREHLMKSKSGKIVSRKASTAAARKPQAAIIKKWGASLVAARTALGIKPFQAVGGKSLRGQALYKKTKSFFKK